MTTEHNDHRFYSFFNRSSFLHVEYCLPTTDPTFSKIKFWAGKTKDEKVEHSSTHYLDYPQLRYLCFKILSGLEDKEEWISYRGTIKGQTVISRIMKLVRGGEKYFFTVGHGPGKEGNNGIIQPVPNAPAEAWTFTTMRYDSESIVTFALEMQAWLHGVTAAQVLAAKSLI